MSNPVPADGQPVPPGIVAAIDEVAIEIGSGVTYVLAIVLFEDVQSARWAMQGVTAHRERTFHWRSDGTEARIAALRHLQDHAIATHLLARRCGRRGQVAARAEILAQLVVGLVDDGVSHAIIESRGPRDDGRDRSVLLDSFRGSPSGADFTYDWRTKAEPLLWYADALAGVTREHLISGQSTGFDRLCDIGVVAGVRYLG